MAFPYLHIHEQIGDVTAGSYATLWLICALKVTEFLKYLYYMYLDSRGGLGDIDLFFIHDISSNIFRNIR